MPIKWRQGDQEGSRHTERSATRMLSDPLLVSTLIADAFSKGKYTVLADVYTKDDEQITCLEATIHFG